MTTKDLYEQDYLAWLEETAKQLRQRQTDVLDWEHLEEEIEALGNQQRHKVDSYLLQLLIHLLLYQYRPMSFLPAKFWQIFSKKSLTNPRP
jgi:uncharacterized damage-inducible protein DinB